MKQQSDADAVEFAIITSFDYQRQRGFAVNVDGVTVEFDMKNCREVHIKDDLLRFSFKHHHAVPLPSELNNQKIAYVRDHSQSSEHNTKNILAYQWTYMFIWRTAEANAAKNTKATPAPESQPIVTQKATTGTLSETGAPSENWVTAPLPKKEAHTPEIALEKELEALARGTLGNNNGRTIKSVRPSRRPWNQRR